MELHRHGLPSRARDRARADRAGRCRRHPAGRHQRLLLRHARHVRGARRAAVHRRGPAAVGTRSPPRHAGALVQAGAPTCASLFADLPEACDNTLAIARRCAVMVETRKPLLPVSPKVRAGQHRGRDRARHGDRRPRSPHGCDRRRCSDTRATIASGWTTNWRHRVDGVRRLLPDRRRLHPVGEGDRAFRSGPAAAPAPARSPPGR